MIIRAFRENQTFTLILSFLISIGLWILVGYRKEFEPDYQTLFNSSLYFLFPGLKTFSSYRLLCSAINIIFLQFNGFYISRIAFKYQLLPKRTLLPYFIFIIISLPYFINYNGLSYPLITLTLILRIIHILFESLEKQKVPFGYFDSALLISIASIFNFYSIFLLVFIIYVLIQFKGIGWRELLFIIFGLIVPYAIFIAILYLFDQDIKSFFNSYSLMFSMRTTLSFGLMIKILFSFTGFFVIISSVKMINGYVKMKIVTRKYSTVFLGLFISTLLIAIFYPIADKDIIFYVSLPLSYLFGYYFSTCRPGLINQILLLLLIGGNVAVLIIGQS